MRKITLSLFALLVTIVAYCGAPQAFNYQAVATGPTGAPVKLKSVALRLSILDGSPTGSVSYQERQTATTDNSGLVNLQIGTGTVISGTFSSIAWSKGAFYLKTEIDTTGGTNYITVGTVQFLSVPYAQYADKSNIASADFPDGLMSVTPIRLDGNFNYVVPTGKTLYVTQLTHNGSATCADYGAVVNGAYLASGTTSTTSGAVGSSTPGSTSNKVTGNYPITIPEGNAITSTSCGSSLVGFTVAKGYSWVLFDLNVGNYTVPAGKVLVIKNFIGSNTNGWNNYYTANGYTTMFSNNKDISFVDAGQTVSASGLSGSLLMMGYLKDK